MLGDRMQKEREYYQKIIKPKYDYTSMTFHFLQAFFFGGIVCIIGQLFLDFYKNILHQEETLAGIYMSMSMIFLSGFLTALGIYDELGQVAKCGLAIPITGFANAAVCSAMEYHKEGIVLGIGANCLKLAGSVLVLGTVAALLVSAVRWIGGLFG